MSEKKEGMSKRQARREEIRRKERQQRLTIIGVIALAALAIVLLIVVPSIRSATAPVGDFVKITPETYSTADRTTMGDPNAKVKIEIFEDYTCSACKVYSDSVEQQVIKEIVEPGLAYYVFYQYPFLDDRSTNKDSDRSANAALCAADQNRFWEYKNMLFANQTSVEGQFSDKRLLAFAEYLGLDMDQFEACYNENRFQNQINDDLALGKAMGITGTPTVFVNGVDISPGRVPSFEQILQAVQAASGN